ncbi:MAG: DUF61 family protein [Methanothrix sp.]|jgi:Uncharacterized protein conserved in archaea|uniref:UPF0216 protein XD72_1489 n=1 Tax=Methanothrix harundinacea TaxID=301375 RepID=A0A101FTG4_9EURY|nr:MAG: hypothetical protein APR56_05405 [Methanosaeta sp. SDB]KUK44165.1 MAG: hypothetical protein XD72_1489 [Methanothrix harundinacea]MDD2638376.1 DUF61 family protein [Methanothrix sp.]MDI9397988.1 DUF61 family protein [Euryarchaeota archaeon]KUK97317.1 MAG: hypothetical protein XE07_0472 [Methanothrix harundinacea]
MDPESRVFAKLVRSLNDHLPVERKALGELLREEKPRVVCRDGSTHRIRKEELEAIERIVGSRWGKEAERLKLPILIEMAPDYGRSAARIRGRVYCDILQAILGEDRKTTDEMVIFRPDIRRLRRELPSATQYAFLISTS